MGAGVRGTALVLVIEDDESIRRLLELALRDEGYATATAANASLALDLLPHLHPDLILLDLRMPVMGGAAFLDAYRAMPVRHAPVVLLTAARESETLPLLPLVDAVLPKPFDIDELLRLVAERVSAPHPEPPPFDADSERA